MLCTTTIVTEEPEESLINMHYVVLCTTCQETCVKYTCSCNSHIPEDIREQDREKVYRDLKDLESIHISPNWNWVQLSEAMYIHVRDCSKCYPSFYTDECPDVGYHACVADKSPPLRKEDIYGKWIWGTPFHCLLVIMDNYEKYNFGTREHYLKHLEILRHIKKVNPRVNDLHIEQEIQHCFKKRKCC